jgi:hypothetical protein
MLCFKLFFLTLSLSLTPMSFAKLPKQAATPPILTAVGAYFTTYPTGYPLVASSLDGGSTWNALLTILSTEGIFSTGSCTGLGSSAVCMAAGKAEKAGMPGFFPFIAVSNAGVTSWSVPTLPAGILAGEFYGSTCSGTLCVASGESNDSSGDANPLLLTSFDSGNTWNVVTFGTITYGNFDGVSCTNATTPVCVATGTGFNGTTPVPFVVASTDGGHTWAIKTITGLVGATAFNKPSCTGDNTSTLCVATGLQADPVSGYNIPLIAVSTDGDTWTVKSIAGLPAPTTNSQLYQVSCAGTGSAAFCAAIGDVDGNKSIITSTDAGNTWTLANITATPTGGDYYSVNCSAGAGYGICSVSGGFAPARAAGPFVLQSIDGAQTWNAVTIPGLPTTDGQFNSTTCTGSGANAICIASGYQAIAGGVAPLLAQTTNGGSTWAMQTVTSMPTDALFYGSGASAF